MKNKKNKKNKKNEKKIKNKTALDASDSVTFAVVRTLLILFLFSRKI